MSFYYDWYFGSTVEERAENMASSEWQLRYRLYNRNEFRALPQELENGAQFDDERHRFMEMFTSISDERNDTAEVFCISQHYELDYDNYEDFYTLVLNQPIRELKARNEQVEALSCNCPYVELFEAECKHMVLFGILYKAYRDSEPRRVPLAVRRIQDSDGSPLGGSTGRGRTRRQTQRQAQQPEAGPAVVEEEESEASESEEESKASESGEESEEEEEKSEEEEVEPIARRTRSRTQPVAQRTRSRSGSPRRRRRQS